MHLLYAPMYLSRACGKLILLKLNLGSLLLHMQFLYQNPHGQVSLKMQNIELVFDVSVLSDFKHRKFYGRMDLTSNFKMDITSNKLGHFSF